MEKDGGKDKRNGIATVKPGKMSDSCYSLPSTPCTQVSDTNLYESDTRCVNEKYVTKKGIRRGKLIRNKFKTFSVYYVNIRGVKSKLNTLKEIINEEKPNVICLNETHLEKNENIEIKGYSFYNNNNKEGKGGVSIGIQNNLKHISVEIDRKTEEYETLWIKISNDKIKIRIGNIYAPQESRTDIKCFEKMYNHIKSHKLETEKLNEKILIIGDFNCKVGNIEINNKKVITKSGKLLKQMTKEQDLSILNDSVICKGVWTRILGKQKSV